MYTDGTLDLMVMITQAAFKPPKEKEESYALIVKRAKTRYFPVFEKGRIFLLATSSPGQTYSC